MIILLLVYSYNTFRKKIWVDLYDFGLGKAFIDTTSKVYWDFIAIKNLLLKGSYQENEKLTFQMGGDI